MSAPTPLELDLLVKFREKLSDLALEGDLNSDMFLLRWLRARDHKLELAEEMLRKSLSWQKENSLDLWKEPENMHTDLVHDIIGHDKDNCPIIIIQGGRCNLKKIAQDGQTQDFLKYKQKMYNEVLEKMKGKITSEGVPVTQAVFIIDLDQASFARMTFSVITMMKEDFSRFEANYPEIVKNVYMINAPWFLAMFLSVTKSIISARTMGKLNAYPCDPTKWMPVLKEVVPMDILPTIYGGNNAKSRLNRTVDN